MSELTLESLAKRVAALEAVLAAKGPSRSPKDCAKWWACSTTATSCAGG